MRVLQYNKQGSALDKLNIDALGRDFHTNMNDKWRVLQTWPALFIQQSMSNYIMRFVYKREFLDKHQSVDNILLKGDSEV